MSGDLPETTEEYIALVRTLGAMVDAAMDEFAHKEFVSDEDRDKALSRAAEVVETISSLRGDSGLFLNLRPEGLITFQKEMYAIEDAARAKLVKLGYRYPGSSI